MTAMPWILSACRTPIGKFQGSLSWASAPALGANAIAAAVERAGISGEVIDEVILGCVLTGGMGQAPARQALLAAGLPDRIPALTINKVCGSGLKAVALAAQAIRAGDAEVVVAGGMEAMSRAGWLLPREQPRLGDQQLVDTLLRDGLVCAFGECSMGEIADRLAAEEGVGREEQDAFALESHRRAAAALAAGVFADELTRLVDPKGRVIERDEGPRADSDLARLAALRPAFGASGTVTPGNASMISDGAAAVVVASERFAAESGRAPLARIVASAASGGAPGDLFLAPVAAVREVVRRASLTLDDIDLFELNEAFAAQTLADLKHLGLTPERVNVDGGAIALGHPIGASGARVLVTLVHSLRRRGARRGVAALCLGGGNAVAMLVERA